MFCEGTDKFRVGDVHLGVREDLLQLLLTFVVDFNSPIDVYYKRQEELQEILSDAKVDIPQL